MISDGRSAREELWRRYDAGALTSAELDTRLALVDRAGDDPAALTHAIDDPVPVRARRSGRIAVVAGVGAVVVALLAVGGWAVIGGDGDGSDNGANGELDVDTDVIAPAPLPFPGRPGPGPGPVVGAEADCPELDEALDRFAAAGGGDESAANPALLSDPPAVPDGYAVTDEDPITPGTDPNLAMSVNAGTPPPVEIVGRDVAGDLLVTMRTFRYASVEDADAAGQAVLGNAVCAYGMEHFDVPDRPEVIGSIVSGPIPTTAFAGFRLAERRFTVAVPAASDADADVEAAKLLAGTIAGLELDAARASPPG